MAIDVTVFKGNGDSVAPEIINPLATADYVARELGKSFLAETAGLSPATLIVAGDLRILPGHIIEVYDSKQGAVWYGKIVHVSHSSTISDSDVSLETSLEVVRIDYE